MARRWRGGWLAPPTSSWRISGRTSWDGSASAAAASRPHVMDRLGLGAAAVLAANPGVVYCSMPGFAADDPRAGLPGWEGVVSAAAAAYSPLARPGETPAAGEKDAPVFSAVPIASGFAAFLAAARIA